MLMFSISEELVPQLRQLERMNEEFAAMMPKEVANAVNLMAHPVAGAAALSALGAGLTSQALGMWLGSVLGAVEASQRLFAPVFADFGTGEATAAIGGKAAAVTLIADARQSADRVIEIEVEAAPTDYVADKTAELAAHSAPTEPVAPAGRQSEAEPQELLPEDFRQPKAIDRPALPDDLKMISGIGPKLEQVLNGLGIWTYEQIAGWSREEVAWVDDYLSFKGRIARDEWIEQAAGLRKAKIN